MRKLSFVLIAVLAGSMAMGQKVLVTAHRGDWRDEPENSLRLAC